MKLQHYVGQVLPLLFFYAFFAFPDEILSASITPLGRLIAIFTIILYTIIHPIYGFAVCIIVIFYYQMDCVEGFSSFSEDYSQLLTSGPTHSNFLDYMFAPDEYDYNAHLNSDEDEDDDDESETEPFTNKAVADFRKEHCTDRSLNFKSQPVRNENATHIFPQMSFTNNTCNPCDEYCGISITQRLDAQENVTYPKANTDWVSKVWETWFSDDITPPYAHTDITSSYSLV
jgi:hypothetical protein